MNRKFLFILLLLSCGGNVHAQEDSTKQLAKVYLIRSTGFSQSAINFRFWVNNEVYCKIKNNRYVVFYLKPGTYIFNVSNFTLPKKEKLNLEVPVEAGQTYYLHMVNKIRFASAELFIEEITYNSAEPMLAKYKEGKPCNE